MPKFSALKNRELKIILASYNLHTNGAKAEMVKRLSDFLKTDEISNDELVRLLMLPEDNVNIIDEATQGEQNDDGENEAAASEVYVNEYDDDQITVSSHCSNRRQQPIQRFTVREISDMIPQFDPTNEQAMSAEHFVDYVESAMRAYGFNAKCLLLAVYSQLKGVARLWLDGQRSLFTSWEEFKTELIAEFGQDLDEAEINNIMTKTVRQTNEKLTDYCFKMQAMGRRHGLSESAIIKYTRNGLRNRELQNAIAIVKFHSMREMRKTLEEYENNIINAPRNPNENRSNKREQARVGYNKSNTSTNPKPEITCFNCNEKGHISRNCTKPQRKERCSKCQRTTHKTENCMQATRDGTVKREIINTVNEVPDTYQEVVKNVTVNGRGFKAFLDCGSSLSLIRERCAIFFDTIADCNKILKGFGGGQYIVNKKIVAKLEVDGNICTTDLYIVRDDDIPENVLLGRNILCQNGRKFIIGHNTCKILSVVSENESEHFTYDKKTIDELLCANEACFANGLADLGKCTTQKMVINLSTDVPINLRAYRVPFVKRRIVNDIINELLTYDIIRKSKSAYASPTVLVEKKNGEHRLCIDYRSLNKVTIKKPFPMPVLEEQFAQLAGNKYFTTLDLRMGYYQIEMEEQSKQYTAFVTTEGHYEFNRMPFGLVNAPAVFQQTMNEIIHELPRDTALAYLDDVIIPSRTINEGIIRLENFLITLTKHGLKLRRDKCNFFQTEIEHLGHVVNENGIKPGRQKLLAVQNFSVPKNVTEVRRFLGLTGFFRKFIRDYAIVAKPITRLLHKQRIDHFQWTTQQQQAFEKLIELLTTAPLLALYDMNQYHEVHTDACMIGLAGVLLQSTDRKSWRPVMYYSRHCTEAEQKYHSYELEVLAVVETFQRFRLQLLTKHFTLVTDCAAIAQTKAKTELKPRIARWWLRMQEFNFEVVHRAGNRLAHVDAMSRAPVQDTQVDNQTGALYKIEAENDDWIVALQQRDERVKLITNILMKRITSPEATLIRRDYILKGYRLYRKVGNERKLYIPKAARFELVRHFHDDMGHFGEEKTIKRIIKFFWFPKMRKMVKEYIKNCTSCCYHKLQRRKNEGELHFDDPIPIPFRVLHMDHLGPFIKSRRGNTHILVITDAFTKFTIVKAVRNTKTLPVINTLNEMIGYFGLPTKIITDRGTCYTSKIFTDYCQNHHIKHVQTAVRTPRANGQVERMNGTLLGMIRTTIDQTNRWDEQLHQLQWVLNSQQNSTTRYTPNELIFNFNINDAIHNHLVAAMQDLEPFKDPQTVPQKYEQVLGNIAKAREKWKVRFDQKHATPTRYHEGDLVVIQFEAPATGDSRKLIPKFRGPYIVKKILGNDRYYITNVPGTGKTRQFGTVCATDRMKPWCYGYPEASEHDADDDNETDGSESADDFLQSDNDITFNEESDEEEPSSENRTAAIQSRRLSVRKGRTVTVQ